MQWEHWRSNVYDRNRRISTGGQKLSVSGKVLNVNIRKMKGNILLPLVQYCVPCFSLGAKTAL